MIYRILADSKITVRHEATKAWITIPAGPLMGGFMAGLEGFALNMPDIKNPRTRFYFTEKGWREVGRFVVAEARREGHRVRVWRRKNPLRSQVVYQDKLQVAILPRKGVARKGRK
jgi:hypothetical protein